MTMTQEEYQEIFGNRRRLSDEERYNLQSEIDEVCADDICF